MPKLYIFIPWEKDKTSNFWEDYSLGKMKSNWKRAQSKRPEDKAREVELIYYNGKSRKRLAQIGDQDVVYVVGHCAPTADDLYASESGAHPIDFKELAQRLVTSGLRESFAGKVKIYGCSGGVASGGAVGWSFTEGFAMLLSGIHERKSCTVVGYKATLGAKYIDFKDGKKHKAVLDEEDVPFGRAKDFRVYYKGGERLEM